MFSAKIEADLSNLPGGREICTIRIIFESIMSKEKCFFNIHKQDSHTPYSLRADNGYYKRHGRFDPMPRSSFSKWFIFEKS